MPRLTATTTFSWVLSCGTPDSRSSADTFDHERRRPCVSKRLTVFTAVFTLGAFVLGKDYKPDGWTTGLVVTALVAFIAAALLAS